VTWDGLDPNKRTNTVVRFNQIGSCAQPPPRATKASRTFRLLRFHPSALSVSTVARQSGEEAAVIVDRNILETVIPVRSVLRLISPHDLQTYTDLHPGCQHTEYSLTVAVKGGKIHALVPERPPQKKAEMSSASPFFHSGSGACYLQKHMSKSHPRIGKERPRRR